MVDLIYDYLQNRVGNAIVQKDYSPRIMEILNKIALEFKKDNSWQEELRSCNDKYAWMNEGVLMIVFYNMFVKKIGNDLPLLLAYIYSSRVAKDESFSLANRLEGYKTRAKIVFGCMDRLDRIMLLARTAPMGRYRGHLDGNQFFDILLLSDVYKVWSQNGGDEMFTKIKLQAPHVACVHSELTKQEVLEEGELAHEAVLNIVERLITI